MGGREAEAKRGSMEGKAKGRKEKGSSVKVFFFFKVRKTIKEVFFLIGHTVRSQPREKSIFLSQLFRVHCEKSKGKGREARKLPAKERKLSGLELASAKPFACFQQK
jgi:stalled ribosome alternative rescue factor ArfA